MYPPLEVSETGTLNRPGGHQIVWEESGNPDGLPVLHLHGGPGSGVGNGGYKRHYDPDRYRILSLDQRGCGRSRPLVTEPGYDLAENTTEHLVDDIEALRVDRGIDAWLVEGVSWGSTLALAYATIHPERVRGVICMAVTAGTRTDVDWITETVGRVFPEEWDAFATFAEQAGIGYMRGQERIVDAYARILTAPETTTQLHDAAAQAWCRWEDAHIQIGAGTGNHDPRYDDPAFRRVFMTLVAHYWSNDCFLGPDGVFPRVDRLAGTPAVLIHGRRDISGPVKTAWDLHRAWPGSELVVVEDEGHGGMSMVDEWSAAADRFADLLAPGAGGERG
ncbi:MAG: alpha/beta fold hydrolase [Propionibacteriales bacterium]|nr:alpha/beta fold hydrolase [Propionibacteriales bacterium]